MIKRLGHTCIGADNLAESLHFYCNVLGLEKTFDFTKNGELYGFYVAVGEMTFIEVFTQEDAANHDRPIIKHLCLEVEDIDDVIAQVRARGGEITEKKKGGDESWQAWMTDPSGVSIEVMQYTAESSQLTGRPCPVDW